MVAPLDHAANANGHLGIALGRRGNRLVGFVCYAESSFAKESFSTTDNTDRYGLDTIVAHAR